MVCCGEEEKEGGDVVVEIEAGSGCGLFESRFDGIAVAENVRGFIGTIRAKVAGEGVIALGEVGGGWHFCLVATNVCIESIKGEFELVIPVVGVNFVAGMSFV